MASYVACVLIPGTELNEIKRESFFCRLKSAELKGNF